VKQESKMATYRNTSCFRIEKLETCYWVTDAHHTFHRRTADGTAVFDEPRGAFTHIDEALTWIRNQLEPPAGGEAPPAPGKDPKP
jgi:hypothetical protein